MIKKLIRNDLMNFKAYHAPLIDYSIKLDANENPYNNLEIYSELLSKKLDSELLNRYPDTDATILREEISKVFNITKSQITIGVGSDQIIDCILRVFLNLDEIVLSPYPSFSMYYLSTTLNRGINKYYQLNQDFEYEVEEILRKISLYNPKVIFICRPNNPTGTNISNLDILKIIKHSKGIVVVDEAYGEFIQESMVEYINEFDNLVVLRTFSKAFGLAGLRIGYAIGSEEIIEAINLVKPPYNINSVSMKLAITALSNKEFFNKQIDNIINNRKILIESLNKCSIVEKIYNSDANFLLVKIINNDIISKFAEEKIMVRIYKNDERLENCIRITVGTKEENDKIVKCFMGE